MSIDAPRTTLLPFCVTAALAALPIFVAAASRGVFVNWIDENENIRAGTALQQWLLEASHLPAANIDLNL